MKLRYLALLLLSFPIVNALPQGPYPAVAAYLGSGSPLVWSPWTSAAAFGALPYTPSNSVALYCQASVGAPWTPCAPAGGGGSGTVTSFSAGNLGVLFSTSVATPTTTPALTFSAATAAQNSVLAGPCTGGTGAYSFRSLCAGDIPSLSATYAPLTNPSGGQNNYLPIATPTYTGTLTFGTPAITDTNTVSQFTDSVNSYFQSIWQNTNSGATASTDLVLNNDQGTSTTHYIDLGINSSGFTGTGSMNVAGAGYLYTITGDLAIGTQSANAIHFVYNNGASDSMLINANGVSFPTLQTTATTAALCLNGTGGSLVNTGCVSPTASAVPFSGVTGATNTNALLVGTGGSLGVSGSGTIAATTATNLAGGALSSFPYQSAANATAFVAGSAVNGTYVPAEVVTTSALTTPTLLNLATYLASPPAIGGTAPNTGSFQANSTNTTYGLTVNQAINTGSTYNIAQFQQNGTLFIRLLAGTVGAGTSMLDIRSTSTNSVISAPGTGALFLNFDHGTGGVMFGSGASTIPANISAAGVMTAVQFIQSQGENVVSFSTTPVFNPAYLSNIITLTGSLTSWTLAAGNSGQSMTLTFCQNATGSFTTGSTPANVRGFFTIGSTASKCSSQSLTYSANQTAWLANSTGVINQ
jgi:hypothetical protein